MQPLVVIPNQNQQVLLASKPGWIQAWMCRCWLAVYRSPLVKPESAFYAPVAAVLDGAESEVIHVEIVDDPNMMFGQAEFSLRRIRRL